MNDGGEVQLFPAWKAAVAKFFSEGKKANDVLSFEWLYEVFCVEMPTPETPAAMSERAQLQFLAAFKAFEKVLLEDHQIALASERGVGYRVVPPAEQSAWAEREGVHEVKRGLRKMGSRLTNVDMARLTPEQRREASDRLAKWSRLRSLLQRGMRDKIGVTVE